MERKQMKDFMNVRIACISLRSSFLTYTFCADVLEPSAKMFQRLRQRLHLEESAWQGGRLRDAMCGQIPEEL